MRVARVGVDGESVTALEGANGADGSRDAPIAPGKIVAIGLNYLDHIRESGLEPPGQPLVFAKFPSSVIGPGAGDPASARADRARRLGGGAGRGDRHARPQRRRRPTRSGTSSATRSANDVSARDLQFGDGQWVRGKSLDTFCPVGPVRGDRGRDPRPAGAAPDAAA